MSSTPVTNEGRVALRSAAIAQVPRFQGVDQQLTPRQHAAWKASFGNQSAQDITVLNQHGFTAAQQSALMQRRLDSLVDAYVGAIFRSNIAQSLNTRNLRPSHTVAQLLEREHFYDVHIALFALRSYWTVATPAADPLARGDHVVAHLRTVADYFDKLSIAAMAEHMGTTEHQRDKAAQCILRMGLWDAEGVLVYGELGGTLGVASDRNNRIRAARMLAACYIMAGAQPFPRLYDIRWDIGVREFTNDTPGFESLIRMVSQGSPERTVDYTRQVQQIIATPHYTFSRRADASNRLLAEVVQELAAARAFYIRHDKREAVRRQRDDETGKTATATLAINHFDPLGSAHSSDFSPHDFAYDEDLDPQVASQARAAAAAQRPPLVLPPPTQAGEPQHQLHPVLNITHPGTGAAAPAAASWQQPIVNPRDARQRTQRNQAQVPVSRRIAAVLNTPLRAINPVLEDTTDEDTAE